MAIVSRPTADRQGASLCTATSAALADLDVNGLTLGTSIYNLETATFFDLLPSTAPLSGTVVAVSGVDGVRWVQAESAGGGPVMFAALAANGGADLVGTTGSITVQAKLDADDTALAARPTSTTLAAAGGAALVGYNPSGTVQSRVATNITDIAARPTSVTLAASGGAALIGATSGTAQSNLDANATAIGLRPLTADLASTASGKGASTVGTEDAGGYFAGTNVEAALQETGAIRSYEQALRTAQGILAETHPRLSPVGSAVLAPGTVYFMQVYLWAGQTVSACHVTVAVAGSAETFAKCGLYSTAGTLLASTADLGNGWETVGIKSNNFATPYVVPTSGIYYVAALVLAGSGPSFIRTWTPIAAGTASVALGLAGRPLYFGVQTAQTDLPSPATIVAGAGGTLWVALS
jgi:hypothetical protein